jgi:hypothetical protein
MYLGSYFKGSGDTIISETKENEFKEFSVKQMSYTYNESLGTYIINQYIITEDFIKKIIKTSDYNIYLKKCKLILNAYLKKYTKKYCASFANTRDINKGYFYIGISDDSQLSGVPMYDTIENMKFDIQTQLMIEIKSIIEYQTRFNEELYTTEYKNEYLSDIMKHVSVDIYELKIDNIYLNDDLQEIITKYRRDYTKYKMKCIEYRNERKSWFTKMEWYRRSVNKMIRDDDVRKEMQHFVLNYSLNKFVKLFIDNVLNNKEVEYTLEQTSENIKNYIYLTTNFKLIKEKIIRELNNPGEYFGTITVEQIKQNKYNPTNITYWITEFRDVNVDKLMVIKPKKNTLVEPITPYLRIIKDFSLMTKLTIQHGVKYCMIKITFPGKKYLLKHLDLAYCSSNGKIKITKRQLCDRGFPCCI